ncbi:MAG: transposase, partial [Candidatus Brocadia sp.]|nr:transposase [Candidatus Brocadia sp.]
MKVKTGCTDAIEYQELSRRKVIPEFNGEQITTDAGGLFLREIEQARGFMEEFFRCFSDYRDREAIVSNKKYFDNLSKNNLLILNSELRNNHEFFEFQAKSDYFTPKS